MKLIASMRERGQIIMMTAFMFLFLATLVGLVFDSGSGYLIKAKLNGAVDAAAIAAGRTLPQGEGPARAAAAKFFNANYPASWLGTNVRLENVGFTRDSANGRTYINVDASASKRVSLMALLGFSRMRVRASAEVVRKDVDLAFVLDTTKSIIQSHGYWGPMLKDRAQEFLAKFDADNDRVTLLHFSTGTVVDVPIRTTSRGFDRALMDDRIKHLSFTGNTNFSEALWNARTELNTVPVAQRAPLRVIVFFTDGAPNSFASTFVFRSGYDCTWPAGWPTRNAAGTIITSSTPSGVWGLNRYDLQDTPINPVGRDDCYNGSDIASRLTTMPDYYDPHTSPDDPNAEHEFRVAGSSPRAVGSSITWANVNNAARNLAQNMAEQYRKKTENGGDDIYIFTLGLSDFLTTPTGSYHELGENLLKAMANTTDAVNPLNPSQSIHDPGENTGVYCWAATADALGPCFDKLAAEIMRLSR